MSLNEAIVEDTALTWFGELGYGIGHGPLMAPGEYAGGTLIPTFSHEEKAKRKAIRRLNPAATVKESLSVQTKEPQP